MEILRYGKLTSNAFEGQSFLEKGPIVPIIGSFVMYITTSNQDLANALITNAKANGINPNSIFVEPVGSNVITGNDQRLMSLRES